MLDDSQPDTESPVEEFTVDELAARANMTVRNVRAYASRGLIEAPRLEGRTGYYTLEHLQRLQLIREFLDRGYTLAAVERAVLTSPVSAAGHTLDLLRLLDEPHRDVEPEVMSRDALAALAGIPRDDQLIDALAHYRLVEWTDESHEQVKLLQPNVVRGGAAAVSLGVRPETVISLFPVIQTNLRTIADEYVQRVVAEIVQPFIDAGLPESEWPGILQAVENLLAVAGQVTLGAFRHELGQAIDHELGSLISGLGRREGPRPASEG